MSSKITHFKGFSVVDGDIKIKLNLNRFDKQFQRAQYELDGDVMNSMESFMPLNKGTFIQKTREESTALQGTGMVVAAASPFGRFLYHGKTMVDIETGSPWAKYKNKKVLVSQYTGKTNAKENLTYSRAGAKALWFDAAKKKDGKSWIKKAKKIAGGGKRG